MLMAKEIISLIFLCSHTHTNCLFQRQQYFVLSSLAIFLKAAKPCSLLPLAFLPSENLFFSLLVSRSIFPFSKGRTLGPKPSNPL